MTQVTRKSLVVLAMLAGNLLPVSAHARSTLVVPAQFPTIQSAVDFAAPGDTIKVLPGTYAEQVLIDKELTLKGAGASKTIIQAPPTLMPHAEDPVDRAGRPTTEIVLVTNGADVAMSGFTVTGPVSGMCDPLRPRRVLRRIAGIRVINGATLDLRDSRVTGIRENPLGLCNNGNGIGVGLTTINFAGGSVGHATIKNVRVDDYQEDGIFVSGPGSTATISENVVTGQGPSPLQEHLGIVIVDRAVATVTRNTISGHLCNVPNECGPDFFSQIQSYGIAAYGVDPGSGPGPGTVISENNVVNNDVGILVADGVGCCTVSENTVTNNRFMGVVFFDGSFTTSENVITGGDVGIQVIAATVDTVSVLHEDVITGTSIAPVQELSCCGVTATAIVQTK